MNKEDEAKKFIIMTQDNYKDYIEKAKAIKESIPYIFLAYEQIEWQRNVFESKPNGIELNIDDVDLLRLKDNYNLSETLPPLPTIEKDSLINFMTDCTSATTITMNLIVSVDPKIPSAKSWADDNLNAQIKLQEKQKQIENISFILKDLKNDELKLFNEAVDSYNSLLATNDISGTAMKIRNSLEKIRGYLYERAKKPREQKIKWPLMAQRLAKGGATSIQYRDLLREEASYDYLHGQLSIIGKNKQLSTIGDLRYIFSRFTLHLFTVLNLINI